MYIQRTIEAEVEFALAHFPVTAITGPRQCGKTTLAKKIVASRGNVEMLDLERPGDFRKLDDPQLYFGTAGADLYCIDEIQRKPELFPLIRSLVDEWGRPGAFLILGSASRDLLRQSSESLAGRISYKRLSPFTAGEAPGVDFARYFERGGFPRSLLEDSAKASWQWRESFVQTFLERDMLQWAAFTPFTMRRLWTMLANLNGQTVNYSALASSLDITGTTVKNYIDLLASTYMVEVIPPWFSNQGKRLVKAPKVYIADSGITACLLGLKSYGEILGHPAAGSIWEQIVLSQLRAHFPDAEIGHYRTSNGAEIDFVLRSGQKRVAVECKLSASPTLSKGNHNAIADIAPQRTFIASPVEKGWPMTKDIEVVPAEQLPQAIGRTLENSHNEHNEKQNQNH
jgi:predicted AAA+ superfamily ATPase